MMYFDDVATIRIIWINIAVFALPAAMRYIIKMVFCTTGTSKTLFINKDGNQLI